MQNFDFPKLPDYLSHLSRAYLRRQYGLNNDMFRVLASPTVPLGEGIEKVADLVGLPVFKKLTGLTVAALIIVSPVLYFHLKENAEIERKAVAGLMTPFKELPVPAGRDEYFPVPAGSSGFTANSTSNVAVTVLVPGGSIAGGATGPT